MIRISTYDLLVGDYPALISVEQLVEITGLSNRTFRAWLRRDTMPVPVVRLGGALRFRLVDVAAWIDGQQPSHPTRRPGRPRKTEQIRRQQGRQ